MKGLMIKELVSTKLFVILYGCLSVFMFIIYMVVLCTHFMLPTDPSAPTPDEATLIGNFLQSLLMPLCYITIFPPIIVHISHELDEKCNFDKFAISSGIDRKKIVTSKMLLALINSSVPFILIIIMGIVPLFVSTMSSFYTPLVALCIILLNIFSLAFNCSLSMFLSSILNGSMARFLGVLFTLITMFTSVAATIVCIFLDGLMPLAILIPCISVYTGLGILFYFLSVRAYKKKQF